MYRVIFQISSHNSLAMFKTRYINTVHDFVSERDGKVYDVKLFFACLQKFVIRIFPSLSLFDPLFRELMFLLTNHKTWVQVEEEEKISWKIFDFFHSTSTMYFPQKKRWSRNPLRFLNNFLISSGKREKMKNFLLFRGFERKVSFLKD